ncbi:MAG: hypothetical protein FJ179_00825 [Gammaproteobacteria bacterium]|nr:hypothetical protein [Gammaproteobacteria bacterium]
MARVEIGDHVLVFFPWSKAMKYVSVVAALALVGSAVAFAQMPPPPPAPAPPVPGMGGPGMDGPGPERREMRRIIIRNDDMLTEDLIGPDGRGVMRGVLGRMGQGGIIEALGLDPRGVERMVKTLDLTPQQLGKITEIMATLRPEMRNLARDMAAEARRLRELTPSDAKYASESALCAKKIGEMSARLVQQSANLRSKVWQELTADQRKKAESVLSPEQMNDRIQQRMKRMRERIKGMGPGGDGGSPRVEIYSVDENFGWDEEDEEFNPS